MKKPNISSLSPMDFTKIQPLRTETIEKASATAIPPIESYRANAIAKALHPVRQFVKVSKIDVISENVKTYTFIPDSEKGTEALAYFSAGQYISVNLKIGEATINRPYSLCSSPRDSLKGEYRITVKRVKDGLATNYILDNVKVGDELEISAPLGNFKYEPLRDAKTIIGLAGGSGITPFVSLAKAIQDGDEDARLVLLYGSRTVGDILFKNEFEQIAKACDKVKVVYVLSDETADGCEHGFITADLIKKYAPQSENYSIFMCGPQAMYEFADKEIAKLGIRRKFVRHELFGEYHNPEKEADYVVPEKETCKITVVARDEEKTVTASINDTIMASLEKSGIRVPARCRSGECGWCHSKLVSGKVYVPKTVDGRRLADFDYGYIHPCCTFPLSDIEIIINPEL